MQTKRTFDFGDLGSIGRFFARTREENGQALIETALTLPLLFLLLLGAVEFAMASYASIEVTNAALAGVKYGTQNSGAAGDTTGIQNAAALDAPNITLGTTSSSLSCICSNGSASTCQPTDCSTSNIETILTVQTQATFNPGFNFPGLPTSFTLHGRAVQKVMQ
jgi:Flp pilus assembly protein TadG